MRTNIVLDDDLMAEAAKFSQSNTKKGLVEEALRLYIQIQKQAGVRSLRGKLHWEGNLDESRRGRFQPADG